jgi:thiosulfate/3-mercaptopyruvate sulfurtransferase
VDGPPGGEPPQEGLTDSLLVTVAALASRLDDPDVRVVDVRWVLGRPDAGGEAYRTGHIPGALFLDLDADLSDHGGLGAPGRHPLPDPREFAARLGARGIGSEHAIVVYDDVGGWVAARLWWMLDALGHRRVSVLDGGYPAWVAAGLPTTTEEPVHPPARLALGTSWPRVIERDELRSRLGSVLLLDARAAPRYRGETEPVDPIPGHIPTAVNAPTEGNLGPDQRFAPPDELAGRFHALGVGPASQVVISCGSGTSACHHALAMRLAGLPDPILYVGSYSDWSRSGYPVARGSEPGELDSG